jgi:hypothetical protein
VPALDLNPADSIRFTLGGKPVDRATLAKSTVKDIDVKPGPKGKFYIVITLVLGGTVTRKMDAMEFGSEIEMWGGLAEFAAGKQADLALEAHEKEDSAAPYGRGGR